MEIVGPVRESRKDYRYILVISDYASRFVITIPMKHQKAHTVAKCLVYKVITKYGAPQHVLTDRGTNFLSTLVKEICILFKIKQMRTTAYDPQTDGLVERFNRTQVDMLTCYVVDEPEQWERFLPYVTFAYNTAVQSTLQECPFFLFFRRLPVLPNDIKLNFKYEVTGDDALMYIRKRMQAQRLARIHLFKAQAKQKFHYNLGTIETKYEVGDWVLLKAPPMAGKFINRWNGPFQITKNYSKVNYEIENLEDKKQKRIIVHVNRIKKFNQREDDTTLTHQNNQRPQIINTDTLRTEDKHNNTDPPTTVKRERGHPRKNITQASESTTYQNHKTPNLPPQHQNTRNTKQTRQPEQFRNKRQNQTHRFIKDLSPPWRGRLRSSPNDSHDYQHNCHCPRCLSLRSERQK
jgi:ribosomal protein L21E